jgi:hypothetical protein
MTVPEMLTTAGVGVGVKVGVGVGVGVKVGVGVGIGVGVGVGVGVTLSATLNGRAAKAAQLAPAGKLSTQTWNAPGCATWAAVTGTLSCVLLIKVTAGNTPSTETTEFGVKPVPFSVSVKPGCPETVAAGLRLARVSGVAIVL